MSSANGSSDDAYIPLKDFRPLTPELFRAVGSAVARRYESAKSRDTPVSASVDKFRLIHDCISRLHEEKLKFKASPSSSEQTGNCINLCKLQLISLAPERNDKSPVLQSVFDTDPEIWVRSPCNHSIPNANEAVHKRMLACMHASNSILTHCRMVSYRCDTLFWTRSNRQGCTRFLWSVLWTGKNLPSFCFFRVWQDVSFQL